MKKNISIQFNSAFLLIVFAMNTLIGLACATGVDMSFNTHHHGEAAAKVAIHVHADGKNYLHHKEGSKHHHDEKGSSQKDDCCNDKVLKLSQTDKAVPYSDIIINPVIFTTFLASYYSINISCPLQVNTANKYYVRGHHPPITDIRIAIQSFQI